MNGVIGGAAHLVAAVWGVLGLGLYLALALSGRRRRRAVRRRGAALMAIGAEKRRPGRAVSGARAAKEWIAPLGAVATGVVLVGGLLGCAAGLAGAYIARRWQRARHSGEQGAGASGMAEAARQLPLAADLLAACISAGAGPREAAEAVGDSLGGPVGVCLARTAAEIRLGGEPAVAWGRFGEIPGAGALSRCLDRAGSTGAPAAEPVARLAEAMRAERASAAVARAQRAGVLITAPVGLCFLPAFLAVGVAPVVIGLATGLLHSG
ncbi:type II secretion system F family protein [Streptomyces sp. NBC_01221]|uniref:type II secretion system F family protein n=1 Tax=Streptomyces sp. NBC_01221 TaxID=2903782 RepID=UPI0022527712|nr:type II secretion system F family protein [Streptomyces sp. NBC_01221]MCX4787628.1 type II secretion system F family protein [Streptomyces sp. NBC_01221]